MKYSWTLIVLIIAHTCLHVHPAHKGRGQCGKTVYKPCAQNLCCCREEDAYCDGHGKKLGYIPKLPKKVTQLRFNGNFLTKLSKETFTNISVLTLTRLSIKNDGVLSITEDAFANLPKLNFLDISSNSEINKTELSLSFKSLTKRNLRALHMRNVSLITSIPERFFEGLETSNIISLILDKNQLTYVCMSVFQYLPSLRHLGLANNAIKVLTVGIGHPTLKILDLTGNRFGGKPPFFCPTEGSVFPNLKKLFLVKSFISEIVPQAWKCLSNLTQLSIGGNMIRHIPDNIIADLTSLIDFRVNGMFGSLGVYIKLGKLAFNSTSLRGLKFSSNNMLFTYKQLQDNIFAACKQLTFLDISKNSLWELRGHEVTEMLSPLTELGTLKMAITHLRSIPKNLLKQFPKLKQFAVGGNAIQELGERLLGPQHLTVLDVQNNNLRVLKPESFPLSVRKTLRSLNLEGIYYDCTCENLWFRNWIGDDGKPKGTNISLVRWPNGYKCIAPKSWKGKSLKTFRPTEASCHLRLNLYIYLAPIGSILLVLIVSIPICIRYRWHIQYFWYKLTKTRNDEERRPLLDNGANGLPTLPYTYVIYHDSDRDFVHQALRNIVEEEFGFKLYIWHRDAAHGSKANIMFDAIDSSSHVLAIISSTFVTDGWCEFQLEIGLGKKNESRKDCLTLLLLENLDLSLLQRSWCVTLVKNATVHWCSDPESVQSKVCTDQLKSRLPSAQ